MAGPSPPVDYLSPVDDVIFHFPLFSLPSTLFTLFDDTWETFPNARQWNGHSGERNFSLENRFAERVICMVIYKQSNRRLVGRVNLTTPIRRANDLLLDFKGLK